MSESDDRSIRTITTSTTSMTRSTRSTRSSSLSRSSPSPNLGKIVEEDDKIVKNRKNKTHNRPKSVCFVDEERDVNDTWQRVRARLANLDEENDNKFDYNKLKVDKDKFDKDESDSKSSELPEGWRTPTGSSEWPLHLLVTHVTDSSSSVSSPNFSLLDSWQLGLHQRVSASVVECDSRGLQAEGVSWLRIKQDQMHFEHGFRTTLNKHGS